MKSMIKRMGIPGIPSHIEYITLGEGKARRHKARCIYYEYGKCQCKFTNYYTKKCWGSTRCVNYKEGSIEIESKPPKTVYLSTKQLNNEPVIKEQIKNVLNIINRMVFGNKLPELDVLIDYSNSVCLCKRAEVFQHNEKKDMGIYLKVGVRYFSKTDSKKIAIKLVEMLEEYAELSNIKNIGYIFGYGIEYRLENRGVIGLINNEKKRLGIVKRKNKTQKNNIPSDTSAKIYKKLGETEDIDLKPGRGENESDLKSHINKVLNQMNKDLLRNKMPEINVVIDNSKSVKWCRIKELGTSILDEYDSDLYLKVGISFLAQKESGEIATKLFSKLFELADLKNIELPYEQKSPEAKSKLEKSGIANMIKKLKNKMDGVSDKRSKGKESKKQNSGNRLSETCEKTGNYKDTTEIFNTALAIFNGK